MWPPPGDSAAGFQPGSWLPQSLESPQDKMSYLCPVPALPPPPPPGNYPCCVLKSNNSLSPQPLFPNWQTRIK